MEKTKAISWDADTLAKAKKAKLTKEEPSSSDTLAKAKKEKEEPSSSSGGSSSQVDAS